MICPECSGGDHGKCKTNERWGQPTRTGLSPKSREVQKHTWCYCQHRGWLDKTPTLRDVAAAISWPAAIEVAEEVFEEIEQKRLALAEREGTAHQEEYLPDREYSLNNLTIKPYGIPPLPPETIV